MNAAKGCGQPYRAGELHALLLTLLEMRTLGPCSLPHLNPKYFLFHPSHQIFQRMHGALNVGKKNN
jgi:hypothetical protein